MKKLVKNVLVGLTLVTLGFVAGNVTKQPEVVVQTVEKEVVKTVEVAPEKEPVEIVEIVTETGEHTNGYWKITDGEYGIELSDGSWALVNEKDGEFIFQPVSMGDWDYVCDSLEELEMCIENYIYLANN